MSKLMRHYSPDQIYFVTSVTNRRISILVKQFDFLWQAMERTQERVDFELIAWAVLPDHFHMLIDPKNNDLSGILNRIKCSFSHQLRVHRSKQPGSIWQSRFWDHIIRDQADMNRHIDYIHYNPVKHGLTASPFEWQFSSIGSYFADGYYALDWGVKDKVRLTGDFGE